MISSLWNAIVDPNLEQLKRGADSLAKVGKETLKQANATYEHMVTGLRWDEAPKYRFKSFNGEPEASYTLYKLAQNWANSNRGLIISGPTGIGKSHISRLILAEYCEQAGDGMFRTGQDLYNLYHRESSYSRHYIGSDGETGESSRIVKRRVNQAAIFALDDLGAEDANQGFTAFFLDLLNGALNHNTRLVVNTNLSLEQFQNRYGARIFDRLTAVCDYVRVEGNSYRQVKKCL